jgi:uncharacterized protein YkwD
MTRRLSFGALMLALLLPISCAIPPVEREPGGQAGTESDDPGDPRIRLHPGDDEGSDPASGGPTGGSDGTAPTGNGGTGAPTGSDCGMSDFEAEVFRLVNERRAAGGLAAYECHDELGRLARAHSQDMCDRDFSGHTNPDAQSPFDRIAAAGISTTTAGENVAAGQTSPGGVMSSWMSSPGHAANIMSPSFEKIGVGHASCSTARFSDYWTQVFAAGVQP